VVTDPERIEQGVQSRRRERRAVRELDVRAQRIEVLDIGVEEAALVQVQGAACVPYQSPARLFQVQRKSRYVQIDGGDPGEIETRAELGIEKLARHQVAPTQYRGRQEFERGRIRAIGRSAQGDVSGLRVAAGPG